MFNESSIEGVLPEDESAAQAGIDAIARIRDEIRSFLFISITPRVRDELTLDCADKLPESCPLIHANYRAQIIIDNG
jgi:hypothetical protein